MMGRIQGVRDSPEKIPRLKRNPFPPKELIP
jgi:hypothetical protein